MSSLGRSTPPRLWRSLDELAGSDEFRRFVEREFPAWADEMLAGPSRRSFLKIMGASLALAGMTGCRWPKDEILPYSSRPDGATPGESQQFATAMCLHGAATGLLVTSVDGRPIKIEGNPDHWQSLGGTLPWHQASILELYDPERSQAPFERGFGPRSLDEMRRYLSERTSAARSSAGASLCVLAEPHSSPSRAALAARFAEAFPRARWYEYTPASRDNLREGAKQVFGRPYRTHAALDAARVIVAIDEDFLQHHPAAVRYARDFIAGRDPHGAFSRLWVLESGFSLTGAVADRRIALAPRALPQAAANLAIELFLERGLELPAGAASLRPALERLRLAPSWAAPDAGLVRDLLDHRGSSAVLAGPRQPGEVHALVHVINAALGNVGATVSYTADPDPDRPAHVEALRRLAREAAAGEVDTLILLGGNAVYDAPADLAFGDVLGKIPHTLHLASYFDETSAVCRWHVPRSHWLETWGDARDFRGGYSITQPLIQPLYESRSDIELLAEMLGEAPVAGHGIVRRTFASSAGPGDGDEAWQRTLHDGLAAGSEWAAVDPPLSSAGLERALTEHAAAAAGGQALPYDVLFELDGKVLDGRFANNGWLQELPDALTKLTWDNAALIAPVTAKDLGIGQEEHLRITVDGVSAELPVFIMPGMAQATVAVALGYGRSAAGEVGNARGTNVYPLRRSTGLGWTAAALERAGGRTLLATTQNHFAIDNEGAREIAQRAPVLVRELDLVAFRASASESERHGGAETEHEQAAHRAVQLWDPHEYPGHKWGMAIDLNACIGCNACVVACQAENNIPVVGKREVATGREMHWIRVDRYFAGDPADPVVSFQPLTCQHCETAPCEQVCPVAATVHSPEGLNLMVYNRCVGTRYCSNNCPYKVRRFNYWNNHRKEQAPLTMIYNPDVTVRSRGVMEKCTFCIQRINAVKIRAKNDRRPIRDGEIVPACAQACPTRAIHFGDLNDEASDVAARHRDERAYALLEELNTRPVNRYQARLRNPGTDSGERQAEPVHGEGRPA